MKVHLIIFLTIFYSIGIFGQENLPNKFPVGFSCGESGNPTPLVEEMTELIYERKYFEISEFLKSKNTGKQFLAIIVLERLDKYNLYKLSGDQEDQINFLKKIDFLVFNCWGCSPDYNKLNDLLEKKIHLGYENWLEKMIPMNKAK